MNAPHSSFVLRERKFWECTDLAALMFRRFIPVLAACFGTCFILVSVIVLLVFGPVAPWLPALVIWWLKPLWERIIMAPIGLLFFKPESSPRMLLVSMKRVISLELLCSLTYCRFSFFHAFLLPVDMFECSDKTRRKERRKWLHRGIDGQLFGLSVFFFILDFFLFCSIYYGLFFLFSTSMVGINDESSIITGYEPISLCWFAALLITEPLYLLSAFALYINRRTLHEGWDLRLAFQKLARGVGAKPKQALLIVLFVLGSSLPAFRAEALDNGTMPLPNASYETRLKEIVDDREFGGTEKVRVLRFKSKPESETATEKGVDTPNPMALFSATALRFIAIICGGAGVLFLIIFLVRRQGKKQKTLPHPSVPPDLHLLSPDRQKRELALAQGLEAWERSDQRLALACLYQVGIALASKRYGVQVPESATEGGCLAIIGRSKARSDFIELFARITEAWIAVSWSDRPIENGLFRQLYNGLQLQEGSR